MPVRGPNKPYLHWHLGSIYAGLLMAKTKLVGQASRIPSAQSHIPALKRIAHDAFDTRHRLTLPDQRTSELLLWGYAIDKQHRVMAWLGPAYSTADPFAPDVRQWKSGTLMHTVPLPGMHFFDAWRIRPSLQLDPLTKNLYSSTYMQGAKNKKPLTLSHQSPLQRPLLMAVRRWRLMHRAANPSSLGHHILIHSRMLFNMVGLRPLPLGQCPPLYFFFPASAFQPSWPGQ